MIIMEAGCGDLFSDSFMITDLIFTILDLDFLDLDFPESFIFYLSLIFIFYA